MIRIPKLLELNAFSITVYYLTFALLWILLSDQLLLWITNDPLLISQYQTYKGIFYVFITGLFLYLLIQKSNEHIAAEKERIDSALHAAGKATWSIDLKTKKIRRSRFHYTIFDLPENPKNWDLKTFYDHIHPDDRQHVEEEIEKTITGDIEVFQARYRLNQTKNTVKWLESRGNIIFDDEGEPIQLAGVVSDITERKMFEEGYAREKELFESLFEQIPVMIDIYDPEINEIRVNKAFEKYVGWTNEEIKEVDLMMACYPNPKVREKATQIMQEASGEWHEFELTPKAGETRIQSWSNIRLSDDTIVGIGLDITEQKQLEKEHERDRLELQKIYDNIPILVNLHNETGQVYRVNKHFEEVVGYKNEDIKHINLIEQILPDKEARKNAEQHMERADGSWLDFKIMTKDGREIYTSWANVKVTNELTIGIGLDTTSLKQKERELEELTARYKNAEKMAKLGHWKKSLKTNNASVSEGFYDIVEIDAVETDFTFELLKQVIHDEDLEKFIESIDHAIETGGIDFEYRVKGQQSGKIKHIHELGQIEYDVEGNPKALSGTIQDITESKNTQAKIRESRELLQKTFESLKESVIILDPETRKITDCNESTTEIFGYLPEELIGGSTQKLHIDDEHFKEFGEIGSKDLERDGFFQTEFVMKTKNGHHFYSDHTVTLVKNEDGETEKIVSVIRDITDNKKHRKRLQELTNRYRRAEEIAGIGHWERNVKTDEGIWSEGFYNVVGLKPGERDTSYQSFLGMIHPKDREKYDQAFQESLEQGTLDVRYRLIKPSTGEVGYYHDLAETSYDEDGNPYLLSGTIQDMTRLEEFQVKLKQRNDFIETTLENLPIGVAVNLIEEGTATLMNNKFAEIYGWPKEVLTDSQTFFKKVYPNEAYREKIADMIMADIASENTERMEWNGVKIITQEGRERIVNSKNIPVYDQNLMISTVVDVTAQFNAEKRLAESEHNYRLLFQKSPLPMWIYDPETLAFIEVNNAALKHYGYSRKEFHGMTLLDIRPEEERKTFKSMKESEDFFSNKPSEWKHVKKSGEVISVLITGSSIDYFGKNYRLILVNDITEQKKAEEMVLASLVEGENKERARIARELHDGLGQYLAAANMNLDALQSEMKNLNQRKQKQFMKGLSLLKHAVTETAQISRNLLPRVVDDYGLALAIRSLVDSYSNNTETDITYYQNIDGLELDRNIELNLYRIAQESLSNAIKYAHAKKINVQLIKDELDLILSIDDNGKGFESSAVGFSGGLGLQTIKTRTGALGGELEIDSKPGKGTFIHVIVPIRK